MTTPQDNQKLITPKSLVLKAGKKNHFFGFPREIKLLCEMYKALSKSGSEEKMISIITRELNKLGLPYNIDKHGQIYRLIPGTPLICAHMDQVGTTQVEMLYLGDGIICGDANLGADDKNGCWMMIKLLKRYKENISFMFTTNEERGGHIQSLLTAKKEIIEKMLYCLVFDRRNNTDIIGHENNYCNADFTTALENLSTEQEFKFKGCKGLSGDANKLKEFVATANLSCGYHEPHSETEYTDVNALLNALQFTNSIIKNITTKFKKHKYITPARLPQTTTNHWNAKKGMPAQTHTEIPIAKRTNYGYGQAKEGWVTKDAAIKKRTCKTCNLKKYKDTASSTFRENTCKQCLNTTGASSAHTSWTPKREIQRSCSMCVDEKLSIAEQPCLTCLKTDHRHFWQIFSNHKYTNIRPSAASFEKRKCGECVDSRTQILVEPCFTCRKATTTIYPNFVARTPKQATITPLNPDTPKGDTGKKLLTVAKDCLTCQLGETINTATTATCTDCADTEFDVGSFPSWKIASPKHFTQPNGYLTENSCATCEHQCGKEEQIGTPAELKCEECQNNWIYAKDKDRSTKQQQWEPNKELIEHTKLLTEEIEEDINDAIEKEEQDFNDHVCPACHSTDLLSDTDGDTVVCNDCYGSFSYGELDTATEVLQ